jgi:hypothetical protein
MSDLAMSSATNSPHNAPTMAKPLRPSTRAMALIDDFPTNPASLAMTTTGSFPLRSPTWCGRQQMAGQPQLSNGTMQQCHPRDWESRISRPDFALAGFAQNGR